MGYRGLVVADDLTGAADTGHRFAERGHDVAVVAGDDAPDADVLVRDTDSRYRDPEDAAERVRAAVERTDAGVVYKKVDSTLRGNLAAEIDAALGAAGAGLAVVAPAFPANGRTTVGGYHLVDGTPVARTEAGTDPDAPVRSSHLPTLLDGSTHPVEHLPVAVVDEGADAVADALAGAADGGPALVACDAARDAHLDAIAAGAARLDVAPLYVGSAGLAGHVRLGDAPLVLGIVGSTAGETLDAIDALPHEQVVALNGREVVEDADAAIAEAVDGAVDTLDREGRAVVTAARSPGDVAATIEAGEERGLGGGETRDRVADALAAVAASTLESRPVDGLLLSGGAVAAATLDALDAAGVRLAGHAVETGVPIGRLTGGDAGGTPVATKAGAFGGRETILRCLDALATHDG